MNYEERYDEMILDDAQQRELEERIIKQERLEMLEKCIIRIKDLLKSKDKSEENDLVSEIEYEVNSLE